MNIYDIAREANVSIATVSRVLNGNGSVRDITRQRVEQVLNKYHYVPSAIARGMVTNSMKTIGVVSIDIRNLYYANVSYSIEQALRVLGFSTILCNTGYDTEQKLSYLKMLTEKKVDSIILIGSIFKDPKLNKPIKEISKSIPIIIINGYYGYPNTYSIQYEDAEALEKSVDYLVSRGRKKFLYLYDADTFSGNQKLLGFKNSVKKHDLKFDIRFIPPGIDHAYREMCELINQGSFFDAVLTSEDITAIGALQCLLEKNIRVPEEVSVVGYNNSILSLCCTPRLSTVDSLSEEMGKTAVSVLCRILSGEKVEASVKIGAKIVLRQSA
jgi:LacI family transcriptional regulator